MVMMITRMTRRWLLLVLLLLMLVVMIISSRTPHPPISPAFLCLSISDCGGDDKPTPPLTSPAFLCLSISNTGWFLDSVSVPS